MRILRGLHHPRAQPGPGCALTIGNFDGVHRGHQAMLALLNNEARHRGLRSCVMTFEPHPRDYFAVRAGAPEKAPTRIATLRDKLGELARCGVDDVVILRFDQALAGLSAEDFIEKMLIERLGARYVLVGDDFRFGARRAGDYALLDATGARRGFDVARMMSYEVHGIRVSSSAVREALAAGDMERAATLLGRPYAISGHVVHGRKLGRELGFRTLNVRFPFQKPAAQGIFVVKVHGLTPEPLPGVASLGVRPTVEDAGRVLLETHCLDWPATLGPDAGYGEVVSVELLHKLHDERRYESLDALRAAIAQDEADARAWLQAHG
ncbi:bifunctional riboflavin kinase/FAD synthetase [Ideonella sp. DXS29W]|uniref:Riboflavin biosynthesis protein n=1 Tax=Ideonella lacteola TaxID=2984193 RepID=A0ABU9BSL8_9BURK